MDQQAGAKASAGRRLAGGALQPMLARFGGHLPKLHRLTPRKEQPVMDLHLTQVQSAGPIL